MPNYIQTTLHPERYHGHGKRPPFFEGWYFKLVDASEQQRYAIIPGIFLSHDPQRHHAFIQVLDGSTGQATYHTYAAEDFHAAQDRFDVRIGSNRFSMESISLDIKDAGHEIGGEVDLVGINPWPVTLLAPGIMGPFGWLPFLETYHGVLSLDHGLSGRLHFNGQTVDLTGGRGYTEKDWGLSFPSAWIWFQSNHFSKPGICVTASVAVIPLGPWSFPGFIVGLWYGGQLHRFTTYSGAKTERLDVSDQQVTWVMRDRSERLEICASRAEGGLLRGPSRSDMGVRVPETLSANVEVRLSALLGEEATTVFHDTGRYAGLEIVGDLSPLLVDSKDPAQS
jgi:hypothetical protein